MSTCSWPGTVLGADGTMISLINEADMISALPGTHSLCQSDLVVIKEAYILGGIEDLDNATSNSSFTAGIKAELSGDRGI